MSAMGASLGTFRMGTDVPCCFKSVPHSNTDSLPSVTPTTTHIEQEKKNTPARSPRSPYFCIANLPSSVFGTTNSSSIQ